MQNYSNDHQAISKAAEAGMIEPGDYKEYLKIKAGNETLTKSVTQGQLTAENYKEEVTAWYFEKAKVGGNVRFQLFVQPGKRKPIE